tara:strand:+ start:15 stop:836 length:822 start_codon:yes stop_codon:yes gene_type:complete
MARVNSIGKESSSNFSPDNGTGLAVRTAIKDIFESLRTVNSAAGDPSGTANLAAFQLHINTDSNLLKIRNAANSDFIDIGNVSQTNLGLLPASGGTLTGVLATTAGTASAPALNFGDSGTGLYKKGTNQLGLTANQSAIAFADQNSLTIENQKEFRLLENSGSEYVAIKAPTTLAANLTLTLPQAAPTAATTVTAGAGYALIAIDESGSLGWGRAGGAEGAAGSSDEVFWENDQVITASYAITNGKNAGSFGPIEIQSGVTVTVGAGETWTVV